MVDTIKTFDAADGDRGLFKDLVNVGGIYIFTGSGNPVTFGYGDGYPIGSIFVNTAATGSGDRLFIKTATTGTGYSVIQTNT